MQRRVFLRMALGDGEDFRRRVDGRHGRAAGQAGGTLGEDSTAASNIEVS